MKTVAAVFADFVTAPSGNPAQLGTSLGARTILAHTLRRLMQVEGLAARCLFVRPRDHAAAQHALQTAGLTGQIDLLPRDTAARPRRTLLTAARKWNLESWRGGLVGSTWFDEFVDPQATAIVLNHYQCHAVLCLDGHQPAFDPALASAMLAHAQATEHESKLVFTQAPPGLAGTIIRREALENVLEYNIPFGLMFSYRPELAQSDPTGRAACFHASPNVIHTAARLTGDTRRSRELLGLAFHELGEDASAADLCDWVNAPGHDRAGPLPVEVELELTTADPLPQTTLRPRGDRVPRRHVDSMADLCRIAQELAEYDDRLVFLGGHGDPLQHPRFAEVCRVLRSAGVYGLGVVTPLVDLTEENLAALFEHRVDVVEVRIDAHTAATYERVHGAGSDVFAQVVANVERLERTRRERQAPQPIVACSLTRCAATIAEMEAFYDDWIRKVGTAVIHGYNSYCGLLSPDNLLSTMPTIREPCRRLANRLTLLADGTAVLCEQDVCGELPVGRWTTDSLREIWSGLCLKEARVTQASGQPEALPLCSTCTEWSRP